MLMTATDWLWSYILIGVLLAIGVRFTLGSRAVQLRLFKRTLAVFSSIEWQGSERGISSLQALAVSVAGRVGAAISRVLPWQLPWVVRVPYPGCG